MDLRDEMERIRRPTKTALGRYADAREQGRLGDEASPEPGGIFLFEETAEAAIFWAVVEHDPEDERFLLVAADGNMLVGSTDVSVPTDADCGPLSLRGNAEIWLEETDFDGAAQIGRLDSLRLEQIARKREQMSTGSPESTVTERETDADTEYQDWQDQLKVAQSELFRGLRRRREGQFDEELPEAPVVEDPPRKPDASTEPTTGAPNEPPGRPPDRLLQTTRWTTTRWTRAGRLYGLAASVLLVASLALSGELYRQAQSAERELASIRSKHQTELDYRSDKHRQELERQAGEHRRELGQMHREQAGIEDFYQQQILKLREYLESGELPTGAIEPQVNVPFALFSPTEPVRGQSKTLSASKADKFFVLLFDVTETFVTYRLRILDKGTGDIMWISGPLRRTGIAELALVVDSEFLPSGRYTLQLYGLDAESTELVGSYTLRLEAD